MPFSNKLTPAEAERLAILAEECGEVIQVVGKILRHGFESYHPVSGAINRDLLAKEMGDLCHAMMMVSGKDVSPAAVAKAEAEKRERIVQFTHHQ